MQPLAPQDGPSPRPRSPDLGQAVERLGDRLVLLVEQSLTLARLEMRQAVRDSTQAVALSVGACVALGVAYAMGCLAALRALERFLPGDAAAGVLAAVHVAAAFLLARRARAVRPSEANEP